MAKNAETEVKLHTPDHAAIEARLLAVGAVLKHARVFERNQRYEDAERNFAHRGVVLRLRQDERARLTYKSPASSSGEILTRTELEVEVSDFDTMDALLRALGYHPYMTYEKYRTTYMLGGAEIVLDEMPYGNFTEIEGDHSVILDALRQLDLETAPRLPYSYTQLFDAVRQALHLDFQDLTFANFAGIHVPETAFQPRDT